MVKWGKIISRVNTNSISLLTQTRIWLLTPADTGLLISGVNMSEEKIKSLLDLFHRIGIRRCKLVAKAEEIKKLIVKEAADDLKQSTAK